VTHSAPFAPAEASDEDLGDLLLDVLPPDGGTMGNHSAREALSRAAERPIGEEVYEAVRDRALALGLVQRGRGRGGSIALAAGIEGVLATKHLLVLPLVVEAGRRKKHPPRTSRQCSGPLPINCERRWMLPNTSIWCWV
jgi:hypothetical protein